MTTQLPTDVLPEVAAFLRESPLPAVIGGENVMATNGALLTTRDPGSGQPLAEVAAMQPDDVDRAVKAAQRAFDTSGWPRLSPNERGVLLHRLADAVEQRKPIIAQIEALDCRQDPRPGRRRRAELRRHAPLLHRTGAARPAPQPAGRRRPRGLDGAASRGGRAGSSSPGTSRCCWSAGTSRPPWPPATRWSSSRPKTRRCRRSIWPGWPRRWAFPTA